MSRRRKKWNTEYWKTRFAEVAELEANGKVIPAEVFRRTTLESSFIVGIKLIILIIQYATQVRSKV